MAGVPAWPERKLINPKREMSPGEASRSSYRELIPPLSQY